MKALTWDDILADRSLRDLPYKIETNRYGKIIMSPSSAWRGFLIARLAQVLHEYYAGGGGTLNCPVQTAEGVRVADVAWISKERRAPYKRATVLPIAPEICVEILAPSNSREEMLEKMTLYYAKGAQEVWLCDEEGRMEFFTALSAPEPVPAAVMCPDFPRQIDVD